jgi:hypothetical protein
MTVRCFLETGESYEPDDLLYLRGITMERYEDGRWTHDSLYTWVTDREDREMDGWTQTGFPQTRGRQRVWQEVELNPLGTSVVFLVPDAVSCTVPVLGTDFEGTVRFSGMPRKQERYMAVSHVASSESLSLEGAKQEQHPLGYTDLPHAFDSVARLARQAVAGEETLLGRCQRIERFLEERCSYSLDGLSDKTKDPVEVFLFDERSGCCTDFASAMVVMLRTLGVPSRVAVGFASDETGDRDGEYLFRRVHAHAWAEVFFGPYGWIRFDPSPVTDSEWRQEARNAGTSWLSRLLGYSDSDRSAFLRSLSALVRKRWMFFAAAVLCFYFLLARRGVKASYSGEGERRAPRGKEGAFYTRFLRIAARAGIRRPLSFTPRELAEEAARFLPPEPVRFITERFCFMRYGGKGPNEKEKAGIRLALAELREALHQRPKA